MQYVSRDICFRSGNGSSYLGLLSRLQVLEALDVVHGLERLGEDGASEVLPPDGDAEATRVHLHPDADLM